MPVKFYCNNCGKETLTGMTREMKMSMTVWVVEQTCKCSDCIILEKESKKDKTIPKGIIKE